MLSRVLDRQRLKEPVMQLLNLRRRTSISPTLKLSASPAPSSSCHPRIVYFLQWSRIPTPIRTLNRVAAAGNRIRGYAVQSMQRLPQSDRA